MNCQSPETSVRSATAFNQPIDAIADRKEGKSGARDGSGRAMDATIFPIGGPATLIDPVVRRKHGTIKYISSGCNTRCC